MKNESACVISVVGMKNESACAQDVVMRDDFDLELQHTLPRFINKVEEARPNQRLTLCADES